MRGRASLPPQPEDELPAGSASAAAAAAAVEAVEAAVESAVEAAEAEEAAVAVGGGRRQTVAADAMEQNAKMNKETKRKNEFKNTA